ncbi:MAG: hypothetical protein ACNS60_14915 [Candidatus Cyclobacteriaceae bacterium M2_1C_046]
MNEFSTFQQIGFNSISFEADIRKALVILSEHLKAKLEMLHDEQHYLHRLFDKYFIWLVDEDKISEIRIFLKKLSQLKQQKIQLEINLNDHLDHLSSSVKNPLSYDSQSCMNEHVELSSSFAELEKEFNKLKKEEFQLIQKVSQFYTLLKLRSNWGLN